MGPGTTYVFNKYYLYFMISILLICTFCPFSVPSTLIWLCLLRSVLYILSTYFVLTPFLRGLRFHAAQVQKTDLLTACLGHLFCYIGSALLFRACILVQSAAIMYMYAIQGYDGALSRLMILLWSVEVCRHTCVGSVYVRVWYDLWQPHRPPCTVSVLLC